MHDDPYQILGLPDDADDDAIRRRYLELVKQFPPEQAPERFTAIRQAFEGLKDVETRLRHRLFETGKNDSFDAILRDLESRSERTRISLRTFLEAVK